MSDRYRQIYNSIERALDFRELRQEKRLLHERGAPGQRLTASRALSLVLPPVRRIDRDAMLKMIAAPDGTGVDGTSGRWEFSFDLPRRRAKVGAAWFLQWDDELDEYGSARIEVVARPFPPMDSVIRTMVDEGKLIYPQLKAFWRKERRRVPDLRRSFRDSDVAIADLIRQGLSPEEVEFSLATRAASDQAPVWVAQTRTEEFSTRL